MYKQSIFDDFMAIRKAGIIKKMVESFYFIQAAISGFWTEKLKRRIGK